MLDNDRVAASYYQKVKVIIGSDVKKFPSMFLMFLTLSVLETLGLGLIGPYIVIVFDPKSEMIDFFRTVGVPDDHTFQVYLASAVLLMVFFTKSLVSILVNYKINAFAQNQQLRVRSILMRAYQNMPYSLYIQRNSSEYIYSVNHLTGHLQGIILQGLKLVSSMAIASFIILFLAYRNLLEVSILIAIIAITLYIYDFVVRKNVIKIGESVNFFSTKMMQGIQEGMNGFKEIRILGCEEFFYKKLDI